MFERFSLEWVVKFLSYSKTKTKKQKKRRKISPNNDSLSFVATRCLSLSLVVNICTARCHSFSLDVPLVCLYKNDQIFVMFVNEEVCQIVLIITSSTEYEFSASIFIFKALMWSVYYYHDMFVDIGRQENYKRLVACGFHSWQINWYLIPRRKKLFMKTSTASRLRPICSWFSFDSSSN